MEMNEILSHSSRMHYYLFLILNSKLHFKILRRGRGSIQNSSISLRGVVCCFFFYFICKFNKIYILACLCTTCTSFSAKPNDPKCNDLTKMILIILIIKSIFWFLSMEVQKTRFSLFWYIKSLLLREKYQIYPFWFLKNEWPDQNLNLSIDLTIHIKSNIFNIHFTR